MFSFSKKLISRSAYRAFRFDFYNITMIMLQRQMLWLAKGRTVVKEITAYYAHLYQSVMRQKENSLRQVGLSDIEPPNPFACIESWYTDIFSRIENNPPTYYVQYLRVIEKAQTRDIVDISYEYCEEGEPPIGDTIFKIFQAED